MGRSRIQLLSADTVCITRYNISKNARSSTSSTAWTLVSFNFAVGIYGIELSYDQTDTPHADMCFSDITMTHCIY